MLPDGVQELDLIFDPRPDSSSDPFDCSDAPAASASSPFSAPASSSSLHAAFLSVSGPAPAWHDPRTVAVATLTLHIGQHSEMIQTRTALSPIIESPPDEHPSTAVQRLSTALPPTGGPKRPGGARAPARTTTPASARCVGEVAAAVSARGAGKGIGKERSKVFGGRRRSGWMKSDEEEVYGMEKMRFRSPITEMAMKVNANARQAWLWASPRAFKERLLV